MAYDNILIVDDKPEWVAFSKGFLRDITMEIYESYTVEDACLQIEKNLPAIVILDLAIPVHNEGLEVLRYVTNLGLLSKVIILSTSMDSYLLEKCWDMGAFAIIRKNRLDIEQDLPREVKDALLRVEKERK